MVNLYKFQRGKEEEEEGVDNVAYRIGFELFYAPIKSTHSHIDINFQIYVVQFLHVKMDKAAYKG